MSAPLSPRASYIECSCGTAYQPHYHEVCPGCFGLNGKRITLQPIGVGQVGRRQPTRLQPATQPPDLPQLAGRR